MNKTVIKSVVKEMIESGELKISVQLDVDKSYVDSEGMCQHGSSGDFVTDIDLLVELEVVNKE
ncbi:conserved hypothetical protein [Vibrio phage 424E50-1]|nr:conserved hypothetical protein [Vibrio phage 424E50-1]